MAGRGLRAVAVGKAICCPACNQAYSKVHSSYGVRETNSDPGVVMRVRTCLSCGMSFDTEEKLRTDANLRVLKSS